MKVSWVTPYGHVQNEEIGMENLGGTSWWHDQVIFDDENLVANIGLNYEVDGKLPKDRLKR